MADRSQISRILLVLSSLPKYPNRDTDLVDKRHRRGLDGTNGTLIAMNTDPALQSDWIASRLMDGRNQVVHNTDADLRPMLKG
jgi:hypothetical protein